ncbi:hypothetical protein FISHEDRAFT_56245 [Fistulina hepatica ATCC 64428]|uniref:Uncharacterized protein n=1 Tax=Fistulina hepatica ATCC 64428 TaxID=1128425 RepID=A0A0D7AJR6_9AGAR|nr:hypothetical protein FISHEDRAFT_56245 [Fistulina hepatica ATCC 64428]
MSLTWVALCKLFSLLVSHLFLSAAIFAPPRSQQQTLTQLCSAEWRLLQRPLWALSLLPPPFPDVVHPVGRVSRAQVQLWAPHCLLARLKMPVCGSFHSMKISSSVLKLEVSDRSCPEGLVSPTSGEVLYFGEPFTLNYTSDKYFLESTISVSVIMDTILSVDYTALNERFGVYLTLTDNTTLAEKHQADCVQLMPRTFVGQYVNNTQAVIMIIEQYNSVGGPVALDFSNNVTVTMLCGDDLYEC